MNKKEKAYHKFYLIQAEHFLKEENYTISFLFVVCSYILLYIKNNKICDLNYSYFLNSRYHEFASDIIKNENLQNKILEEISLWDNKEIIKLTKFMIDNIGEDLFLKVGE